jgi:hypothetical protein
LGIVLGCIAIGSLLWILVTSHNTEAVIAEIYQDGVLIRTIPLNRVDTPYTFTVTGENGCTNEISVQPGKIGILSANCPDKICVHQGYIDSSLLPITCLPNRLVIRITEEVQGGNIPVDALTY